MNLVVVIPPFLLLISMLALNPEELRRSEVNETDLLFWAKKRSLFCSMVPSTSHSSCETLKHVGSEANVSTLLSSPALYPPSPPTS